MEVKMAFEVTIPLMYKSGRYNANDIPKSGDMLLLSLDDRDILTYDMPKRGYEVRLYSVEEQQLGSCLYATYNAEGMLKYAEIIDGDEVRLIYIGYTDEADERAELLDFAEQSAEQLSEKVLSCKEKIARLFIEFYFDGDSYDYAVKVGTEADKQALLDRLSDKEMKEGLLEHIIDNSGDYPYDRRIPCDTDTASILLRCAESDLFRFVTDKMTELIKARVIDKLNKTDDFKFIVSEYD